MKILITSAAIILLVCVATASAAHANSASNRTADGHTGQAIPQKMVVPTQTPEKVKNNPVAVSQERPFTCRAGQYLNLGQCISDCQPGGKQNCELTCKACVRAPTVTPVMAKVRQNATPAPKSIPDNRQPTKKPVPTSPVKVKNPSPTVTPASFTCRAGQYPNLGRCVSDCQPGGKQNCELTCKACVKAPAVTPVPAKVHQNVTPVPENPPAARQTPFTCRAGQYKNLGQCVSDCQSGGKQSCELTCKACVKVVQTVTPVPAKVQQNVTPVPRKPKVTQTPFTCKAGQYKNLGQCVSDCQAGGKQSCELTCKACVSQEAPKTIPKKGDAPCTGTSLALLVKNAAALDTEETAALQFARARGVSITPVDAGMVTSQEGLLSGYRGYWAASDTEPAEWKDPVALSALKGELESGKHLFMMAGSMYLGQYLGYGTAGIDAWGPCVLDEVYLVDPQVSSHRVLSGLGSWIPPSKPDNPDQLLWKLRRTGGWSHYTFKGNNEIAVQATGLWVRYGFASGSPSPYPVLDARYGITSTGERFLFSFPIFREVPVGQGSVGYEGVVFHLTREWGLGPMGEKLLTNKIKWALGE